MSNPRSQKIRIYNLCFGLNFLCCCFRSEATGNCLYASFYSKHPSLYIYTNHRNVFASLESLLKVSVSHKTLDTGLSSDEAVKEEAINNCHDKSWSSFLCISGLSSVIQRSIYSLYPDFVLFNQLLSLRVVVSPASLFILFVVMVLL